MIYTLDTIFLTHTLFLFVVDIAQIVRKAGQRIEWLLKKGAKYFGIAIIKVFNQPGLYTEESRTCVC
jgi:hypothetical protein